MEQMRKDSWIESVGIGAGILRDGGIVAFPTETVYGLGADAFNEQAVARVFACKGRPRFDPLIVHIAGAGQLPLLASDIPPAAALLVDRFWPGPLTVVLPKKGAVPDLVTAGLPTVAVRMPAHPAALELIRLAGTPVAAPSANRFGRISPTSAAHVTAQLEGLVDLIIDGGSCSVGVESTIVGFFGGMPRLLRAGGIPVEELEAVAGPVLRPETGGERPEAPGQLKRHYAPLTPLIPLDRYAGAPSRDRCGHLAFNGSVPWDRGFGAVEVLSEQGDLAQAAARLFAALHWLDGLDLEAIVHDPIPMRGLGLAINDRLRRGAAGNVTGEDAT